MGLDFLMQWIKGQECTDPRILPHKAWRSLPLAQCQWWSIRSLCALWLGHGCLASRQRPRHSDPTPCSTQRGHQGQPARPGSPRRTEQLLTACGATLQPTDTLLAGPVSAPRAGCPGKHLALEPEAAEHISSGASRPRASAPSHHCSCSPCRLPSALAFKYIRVLSPQACSPHWVHQGGSIWILLLWLPSLIMAILYSSASVCGISQKKERGRLATRRGLRKRWEGSDFHVIIHFYKRRCQVHTGNTAVVLFS